MLDFSIFFNSILPFIGKIFGVFSYLGTVTYSEFLTVLDNYFGTGILLSFTNVITGAVETISVTGFTSALLSPLIVIAQASLHFFGLILNTLSIPYDYPLWVVLSTYLLVFSVIFGIVRGVVTQFASKMP